MQQRRCGEEEGGGERGVVDGRAAAVRHLAFLSFSLGFFEVV